MSRARAAVLLSFYTSPEQPLGASMWLDESIRALRAAGLQSCVQGRGEERAAEEMAQRRIWWSILLRDRSLCLGLRRPPQIVFSDLRLMSSRPAEEDFEAEIGGSQVYDPTTKRALFVAFQDQCELASLLTEIVSVIFMTHGISIPSLPPEPFKRALAAISKMKTSLGLWKQGSRLSVPESANTHDAVIRFSHTTFMYYQ